jgi:hypothetical protein
MKSKTFPFSSARQINDVEMKEPNVSDFLAPAISPEK